MGLLLSTLSAGDIKQLLQGVLLVPRLAMVPQHSAQQQMRAVSC